MKNQKNTDWFILNLIHCPNCNGKLVAKPIINELKNVLCEACNFTCRFETSFSDPEQSILSLPSDELDKLISDKVVLPPLIIHYKWEDSYLKYEKVYFFPFIAYRFLKEEAISQINLLSESSKKNNVIFYNMFELPQILMYEQPSDEDLAEIASHWENTGTSSIQRKFKVGYARAALLKDRIMELRRKRGIIDEPIEENDDDEDEEEEEEDDI